MLSANQITGLENQLYLQNKLWKTVLLGHSVNV